MNSVTLSLPFSYTGVDFAGLFTLKASNLRNANLLKRYAAVFLCIPTRAVYLEVFSKLSKDKFLACFARFTSRKDVPKAMFFENGRNLLGAKHWLLMTHEDLMKYAEKSLIEKYCGEAVVKIKSHFKKGTGNLSCTFEEFYTMFISFETILNSYPISPLSENQNELLPLNPGYFLRNAPIIVVPEVRNTSSVENISFL